MMDAAQLLTLLQNGAGNLISGACDSLGGLNFSSLGTGGIAAALAVVWYFVRILRMVVSILFSLCILLLVLQLAGVADLSSLWQSVSTWFSPAPAPAGN